MKLRISLCLIVKNERENLRRCLESVTEAVDEIIVIDTGSTDGTPALAASFGARVQECLWNENFSDARNVGLELATGEWILIMDADEALEPKSATWLRQTLAMTDADGYFLKILNFIGGDGWQECCPDLVFRLFRNDRRYRFHGAIHEQIADVILAANPSAKYEIAEECVLQHYGYLNQQIESKDKKSRNLAILERELTERPEDHLLLYHYGVELYRGERYAEAAETLTRAGRGLSPQTIYFPKLLRYIVMAYYEAGNFTASIASAELGLQFYPDYADLCYYGGLASYAAADYDKAYGYFHRTLAMPKQPSYYAGFGGLCGFRSYYHLGRIAEKFLNEEEALRFYLACLRDNPAFWGALERIAFILTPLESPDDTRASLEKICEFCTPEACFRMANIFFSLSAFDLALEYFERGQTEDAAKSPQTLLWRAICLIQQRRSLEALTILDDFPPDNALYPLAKLNELLCFWLEGNRKKSYTIANTLFSLGLNHDTGAVVALFQDDIGPDLPTVALTQAGMDLLLDIVDRVIALGEREKAAFLLARLDPAARASDALRIGTMYLRHEVLDEAERYFECCVHAQPSHDGAWFQLGEIKRRRGETIDALIYYRRALAINGKEPAYPIRIVRACEEIAVQMQNDARQSFPIAGGLLPKERAE